MFIYNASNYLHINILQNFSPDISVSDIFFHMVSDMTVPEGKLPTFLI